jgi:hypothetical protein
MCEKSMSYPPKNFLFEIKLIKFFFILDLHGRRNGYYDCQY